MIDHNEAVLLREITVMQFTCKYYIVVLFLTEHQVMIHVEIMIYIIILNNIFPLLNLLVQIDF